MSNEVPQEFFVERVVNMSHANGVFRVTFAQQGEGETVRQTVRLLVPANQLGPMLQGISKAARDIGEQVQARLGTQDKAEDKAAEDGAENKADDKAKSRAKR